MKFYKILLYALIAFAAGASADYAWGSVPNPVTGSVSVTDSNSLGSDLVIGDSSGAGTLSIGSGGVVEMASGYIGADPLIGSNRVIVSGTGLWVNSADLHVGAAGPSNALVVTNGGRVLSEGVGYVGEDTSAVGGSIIVTGAGSSLTNQGAFYLGQYGGGNSLMISNGGSMVVGGDAYVSTEAASSGNGVIITGSGSSLKMAGDFYFGFSGGGNSFVLSEGASLSASSSILSLNPGAQSNSALVTGTGTLWSNSGALFVGSAGGASLTVADGASVAASQIDLGGGGGGTGALTIGSGGAPGFLQSPTVNFGPAGGTLAFNHNSTNYTFSPAISGAGTLSAIGSGRTILQGDNSAFSGSVDLHAGILALGSSNALGSASVTFRGNATLQAVAPNLIFTNATTVESNAIAGFDAGGYRFTVSTDITGAGGVLLSDSTGRGTLVLSGSNSYTGGTTIGSGYLLLDNPNAIGPGPITIGGSSNGAGLIVDNQTLSVPYLTIDQNGLLHITRSGILNSAGDVTINGGRIIDNGLLIAPNLRINAGGFLGGNGIVRANVFNNGTVSPGNSPDTLTIQGNYTQGAGGSILIEIASSSQFDRLVITGAASLSGTLEVLSYGGYKLNYGDQFQFLTASEGITGSFDSIIAPEGFRGRLLLSENNTAETLLIAPASYTQLAEGQNQINVASALDTFIPATSGDRLTVSTTLDKLTASQYQQAFEAIQPTIYQSLGTIAFNLANAQNMELAQRLWGQRVGGSGFSMNGFADNTPVWEGQGDGENNKGSILQERPDNRWGLFVDGNGVFAQANSANMLPSYNAQSGGVTTGVSFRVSPTLSVGAYTGYEGTYAKFNGGSSLIDNSVRFGLFGTYGQRDGRGFYMNAVLGGGYNGYQVSRSIQFNGLSRTANSSPGAGELDTMIGGGYDLRKSNFTFGPTASLQYTYLGINSLDESGAQSLDYSTGGWNTSSMLSSVGAHAAYAWQANNNILIVPQINLSWQHEFMQNPYAINGSLGGSPNFSNWSSTPIRDFLYTGIGFTMEFAKKWNTAFFYNAAAGNSDLVSQNIFWSAGVKF
jgi:T5SS/PEP-CTERM-associated repeat protein/autotransporter-associated beta strand protein